MSCSHSGAGGNRVRTTCRNNSNSTKSCSSVLLYCCKP
jgi:hypothetical protein